MKIIPPLSRVKRYLWILAVIVAVKIPWVFMISRDSSGDCFERDIRERRRYLIDRVYSEGAGPGDMPSHLSSLFQGEWAMGTYSMLSAALANISFILPDTREESLNVVRAMIYKAQGEEFKKFDTVSWNEDALATLDGDGGHIGYLGHLNWMISAYKYMGGGNEFDSLFADISHASMRRLKRSPGYCLRTYPFEIPYVPDNVVVIASLSNFAKLNKGDGEEVVKGWLSAAKKDMVDSEYGLLTFSVDGECRATGLYRGSSSGWNSFYLPFIDKEFAKDQYKKMKAALLQRWPVTGLREYPRNVFGIGDVDSGPAIFGLSPSGTGFALGGATHESDEEFRKELLFTSKIVGSTMSYSGRRFYLAAPLVGDAIMLAMNTARVWEE